MNVHDAEIVVVGVDNYELGDGVVAHYLQCADSIFGINYAFGIGMHDVGCCHGGMEGLHHTAQIAVGDYAAYGVSVHDYGASETFGGHLKDGLVDRGGEWHGRAFVLYIKVADAQVELFAECATRVEACEVVCCKIAAFDECYSECIAHYQLGGGATCRSKIVGAGFVGYGGVKHQVGFVRQKRICVADDGNKFVAKVLNQRNKYFYLWGVAALGDAHHHIVGQHHSEVAMYGVGGMHKQCRCARGVECGYNLGSNISALANTCHDNTTLGEKDGFYSRCKRVANKGVYVFYGFFFVINYLIGNLFYLFPALQCEKYLVGSRLFYIFVKP